ncbi:protein phosphatase 2C domain-containing protein [Rhodoluna sp.]|uniref:PP2C family protein-serine/threonine phosphatase n=1 Tax=Rhodoluna sp. TaxID=1969481 RepID=UPI0025CFB24D|nr:protein phosphatase 2C domain-containing protein [Rhodoluna sp.]
MPIKTLSYAGSDIGRVRSSNQDSGYSGYNLHFVADGMGGHAGGDIASALCAQRIARIDSVFETPEEATKSLIDVIWEANGVLGETAQAHPELAGMGTTFSGIIFTGDKVTVGHIGDSRIYLCRDDKVTQITVDHTFVQRLVDTGRITAEEALVHPRRSVLMRVLGDVEDFPDVDTQVLETLPGDRWMLCSDGLSGVVPEHIMNGILTSKIGADEATELLIGEALEFGAPDNVTVVVVDVVSAALKTDFVAQPTFVGSSANDIVIDERKGRRVLRVLNPLHIADLFRKPEDPAGYVPESDEYLEKILRETRNRIRWRLIRQISTLFLIVALSGLLIFKAYEYTQTRFYIGVQNNHVTIYKGIKEALGPLKFSSVYQETNINLDDLSPYYQHLLESSISAENIEDASRIVATIEATVSKEAK